MIRGAAQAVTIGLRALRRGRTRLDVGVIACAIIAAGLNAAGSANAQCVMVNGAPVGASCPASAHGDGSRSNGASAAAGPASRGATQTHYTSVAPGAAPLSDAPPPAPSDEPPVVPAEDVAATSPAGGPLAVAASMLGTDTFGDYGCEDYVDAAYGRTTATGIPHNQARSFYESMAAKGLGHHETPIPAGALAFSAGPDGEHVDISRGDGTFYSGGVQGIKRGYGDGHNIQVLPAANLGSYTLHGWVYPPW